MSRTYENSLVPMSYVLRKRTRVQHLDYGTVKHTRAVVLLARPYVRTLSCRIIKKINSRNK